MMFRSAIAPALLFCSLLPLLLMGSIASAQETAEAPSVVEANDDTKPQETTKVKGLVAEQPAEGRFIKTDQGYMVPYTETIPGTEIQFEMVPVPAGTFLMGSPEDADEHKDDEGPQVTIAVEPFWMGKHEVTWGEYRVYMDLHDQFKAFDRKGIRQLSEETEIDAVTAPSSLYDPSFTFDAGKGPDQPAATMTQYSAKQYTKWLSILLGDFYRLPAESEWEYACRAGSTSVYSFGDDPEQLEEYAWYDENADYERHDVGQKKPNAWGLYDMHGNVAEWVLDQYEPDRYATLMSKEVVQMNAIASIRWPTEDEPYIVRGGSWELYAEDLRSATRLPSDNSDWKSDDPNIPRSPWWCTTEPSTGVGFRLIRPLTIPDTREAKEEYWKSRSKKEKAAIKFRLESDGKGAKGFVDQQLPKAIEGLKNK